MAATGRFLIITVAIKKKNRFSRIVAEKIREPQKNMVVGKAENGAGGKNMLSNLTVIRHIVFDWLDEIRMNKFSVHHRSILCPIMNIHYIIIQSIYSYNSFNNNNQ